MKTVHMSVVTSVRWINFYWSIYFVKQSWICNWI